MKTLLLANQKGGVGKSAMACQLAYFLAHKRNKRVMVIDLDHQANTTKALKQSESLHVSELAAAHTLSEKKTIVCSSAL